MRDAVYLRGEIYFDHQELTVLNLLSRGMNHREMAMRLDLSIETILDLSKSIFAKQLESLLRKALELAENVHGADSAEARICLIELYDFLERAGRLHEADPSVLIENYKAAGCEH